MTITLRRRVLFLDPFSGSVTHTKQCNEVYMLGIFRVMETIWQVFLRFGDRGRVILTLRLRHQLTFYPSSRFPVVSHFCVSPSVTPSQQSNHATTIKIYPSPRVQVGDWERVTCNIIPPALHPSATIFSTTGLTRE